MEPDIIHIRLHMSNDKKILKTETIYKLDQFFTKSNIASECVQYLNSIFDLNKFDLIIEPSAGRGDFVKALPTDKLLAIEIDPELCKDNSYLCKSWFDYEPDYLDKKILVVGNPPFGTQNKKSVDFFNHAAKFAEVIAFIIPRTWNKQSIHNRLDKNFILSYSKDLDDNCFYGDKFTTVKCCFQIWSKSIVPRIKINKIISHPHWEFLPYINMGNNILIPPQNADFVILAYGSKSGQISDDLTKWKPKSVHFIKSKIDLNELKYRFLNLDFSCANNSARQSSLCKNDLVRLYTDKYGL